MAKGRNTKKATIIQVSRRKRHHAKRQHAKRQYAKKHNAKRQHAKGHRKKGNLHKGHHLRSLLRIQAWILNSFLVHSASKPKWYIRTRHSIC